jgi:chloride channel protein, CIC family
LNCPGRALDARVERCRAEAEDSMTEQPLPEAGSRLSRVVTSAVGGLLGGSAGAALVIGVTEVLKGMLAVVSRQDTWVLIAVPLLGLALAVAVLYGSGLSGAAQALGPEPSTPSAPPVRPRWARAWRAFPPDVARADITADVVAFAGEEDRFPWRLAPIRLLAIVATVGLGAPMGTEAPAAYLGVVTGAAIGDRGHGWRRLLRPAAVAGGAAGVSALMGIPLVGTAFILEMGRRQKAPLTVERMTAALVGGIVGWLMNRACGVDLIHLVVPKEPPHSLPQALATALLIGALAGSITSLTGAAIYRAKAWEAHPAVRLAFGGVVLGGAAAILATVAAPQAAVGPGGGSIVWVETMHPAVLTVLAVALLRALATTAAAAAGGCGGVFVPFLAVGDLAGRVFAPGLGLSGDVAGSAGAASGIAGGYRLPFTAVALVLEQGGPPLATLTCLATVAVATVAGAGAGSVLDLLLRATHAPAVNERVHQL